MARTLAQIEAEIFARKALEPVLDGWSSPSAAAIWRIWIRVFAFVLYLHEQSWAVILADLTVIASASIGGTYAWYARRVLAFQFGHTLTMVDDVPGYATVDTAAQVVKKVAVQDGSTDGRVSVKVAKLDADGLPAPLATDEFDGVKAYMERVKLAGTRLEWVNEAADSVQCHLKIYYLPDVGLTIIRPAVEAAIKDYIQNKIEFNGRYYEQKLFDAIQIIDGVADVQRDTSGIIITDYAAVITTNPRTHIFSAGAARVAASPALSATLNFIAAP